MSHTAQDDVVHLLEELEARLDPQAQQRIRTRHVHSASWHEVDRPPVLIAAPWDTAVAGTYPVVEAVKEPAKMLANELRRGLGAVINWLRVQDDRPLQIRPDFGIGLVASVFGARVEVVANNPPWVHPLSRDGIESRMRAALDAFDVDEVHLSGWIPRVTETLDYYASVLRDFPRIASSVAVALPDLQGPFETASMLWGSDIFRALIDEPDLVDRLISTVAAAMGRLHDRLRDRIGAEMLPDGFSHQHGSIVRGNLLLRCDSNVMMSPRMYASQVIPHDKAVLNAVRGGSFHSCGRWQQNIPNILAMDEVGSLDFGSNQSQLNDIDEVYQWARRRIKHLNLVTVVPDALRTGAIRERFPTGVTLQCLVADIDEASRLMADYRRTAS